MTDHERARLLFEKHKRLIYRVTRSVLEDEKDVQDAMQDTAVSLWNNIGSWKDEPPDKQAAYVARAAHNKALNYRRHGNVEAAHVVCSLDADSGISNSVLASSSIDLEALADGDAVNRALDALEERDQTLLRGKDWFGLSDKELAEACLCQPDSVRTLLSRARKRLKKELEKEINGNEIV